MKTTVVCLRQTGRPEEVVQVEQWDLPELQPHQIQVEPLAAPINPADLNVLEGNYAIRPTLPTVVGNEGVGVITQVGSAVNHLHVGQRIVAPMQLGWWCDARIMDAAAALPVADDLPVEVAAMLAVNPTTAYRMLEDFVPLQPGDWVVQNVANSGVGRAVIEIARHRGLRTVNLVRRKELIDELKALGADVVVTDETPLSKQIRELTNGAEVKLGLNAVGGESARQIAKSLAASGTIVTYGAMSREPMAVENGLLIFKDICFRGMWISQWYRHATRLQTETMFEALTELVRLGKLRVPVEHFFPLEKARKAIAQASRGGRGGKIMFRMKS